MPYRERNKSLHASLDSAPAFGTTSTPISFARCKYDFWAAGVSRSSFVAIKLNKGENNITITFHQKGLGIGVILTLIGIACLLLYLVFKEKIKYKLVNKLSYFGFIIISGVIFLLIYIFPVAINVIQQIK